MVYILKKGYSPWIKRSGKLGGKGFLSKSSIKQHKILDKCVKEYGYKSCLSSRRGHPVDPDCILVLMKSRKIKNKYGIKLNEL